jgi:hypothetical protein
MEYANYRFLYKHLEQGGKCNVMFCKDGLYDKVLKQELEKEGIITIPYEMVVGNGKISEGFMFESEQREQVERIRQRVLIEHGLASVVPREDLLKCTNQQYLESLRGMDPSIVRQLKEVAAKEHFCFSMEERADGKYDIYCLPEHRDKLTRAWFNAEYKNMQVYGDFIKQRADFEIANEKNIAHAVQDPEATFYLVEEYGDRYIEVDDKGYTYHSKSQDGDELKFVMSKDDPQYQEALVAHMAELQNAVFMEHNDYTENKKRRREILHDKYGKPFMSQVQSEMKNEADRATAEIVQAFDAKQRSVEMKFAFFDNKEQRENDSPITNDLVSYTEFFAHQWVNDTHDTEEHVLSEVTRIKNEMDAHPFERIDVEPSLDEKVQDAREEINRENAERGRSARGDRETERSF